MNKELELFNKLAKKVLDLEESKPVASPINPKDLYNSIDLHLKDSPISDNEFENVLSTIVEHTPKTASKHFFNQLFGGRKPKAVLGDLLAVLLNNSMYTYKVAGVQVGIEKEILNKVAQLISYPETFGGTFTAGGSMSNLMAMLLARDVTQPDCTANGVNTKLIAYTSSASHYSIAKNASFIGIGKSNVRKIATNHKGEMDANSLQKQLVLDINNGLTPFFINATAGTTVLGSFDPIIEISEIAQKYNVWLHVDGAYCGGVLFSAKHKHLITGVEKANSFSVNAHKMLGTPLTCSLFFTSDKNHLYNSVANEASYLYQTDEDEYNLGKTSLQCGRRNDALKFWTLWKSIGTQGLEKMVNRQFQLADIARDYINNHPDYTLYSFPQSISICFNYKNIPAQKLCTALYEHGKLMVGFGTHNDNQFIRLVAINSTLEDIDMIQFFKILESFVEDYTHEFETL